MFQLFFLFQQSVFPRTSKFFCTFIQDKRVYGFGRQWKKYSTSSELFVPLRSSPLHTLFPKWIYYLAQSIISWLLQFQTLLKSATVSLHSYVQHLWLRICLQIAFTLIIITIKNIHFCLQSTESQR